MARTGEHSSGNSAAASARIELRGERLMLHPERAVSWPARRTLIIADPHFGKDDIFRRAGIALPRGPAIADLQRLGGLIDRERAERLLVLGDFVHGATRYGDSFLHAFRIWRQAHSQLAVEVIAGNHDRREAPERWSGLLEWRADARIEPPFVFAHEPDESEHGYVVAGHIHPVLALHSAGTGPVRVPVYWVRPRCLVLPSFGSFTGGARIDPGPLDAIYAAAPERVIRIAS